MVVGGSGAGDGDFDDAGAFGDFDDAGAFDAFDDADAFDDGRDDWPERDEPDDGLLLVGSFSVNDLNMGCPIVTR